jgi:hypothetical protein
VERQGALFVQVSVEQIERRVVLLTHDGSLVAPAGLGQVRRKVRAQAKVEFIAAKALGPKQVLGESGKPLVEPTLGPITTRDVVAEPLVREFVGDQIIGVDVQGRALVDEHMLRERCGRGVLHATKDEVADDHLGVLVPRIVDPKGLGETPKHLFGSAEGARTVGPAVFGHPIRKRHAVSIFALLGECACHDGEQVARQGLAHGPYGSVLATFGLRRHKVPIAEHGHPLGHGDLHPGAHLHVRLVVARQEIPGVLFLALGPHLHRLVRVQVVRRDEVESAQRLHRVLHAHFVRRRSKRHLDSQDTPIVHIRGVTPVHREPRDLEGHGVELERSRRFVFPVATEPHRGGYALFGKIQLQRRVQLRGLERAVALEVARCAGEGK